MYNFLSPRLFPKVSSPQPDDDHFQLQNLISDDDLRRARGYIGYTCIKPPVDVRFEFLCDIHIKYLVLHLQVGIHQTIAVEILAGEPAMPIAYHWTTQPILILCDSKHYNRGNPPPVQGQFDLACFKLHTYRIFQSTNYVCVRIIRCTQKSVPCLAKVEIWGGLARTCTRETRETIRKLTRNRDEQAPAEIKLKTDITNLLSNDLEIPEDFKDALTMEVMAIPMTLPSGNSVDQSTLQKCIANDAWYGRRPTDPFTGLEFQGDRKPIINVSLKSRIDMFLLMHSHRSETANIPRTLGKKQSSDLPPARKILKLEYDHKSGDKLEDSIAKVMANSNFVCFTKTVEEPTKRVCGKCKTVYTTFSYEITTCKHHFCDTCLRQLRNTCDVCKLHFENRDVIKLNH